jgi:serine/threonine-protein kinase RsbW
MTGSADPVGGGGETRTAVVVLSRDVREAARSRQWLRTTLHGRTDPQQLDDACLVVSELVTNALRHGLGEVVVRTAISADDGVRVSVTDWSGDQPCLAPADPGRVGGVGLRIVDELARSWGIAAFPGGKTVWATIARSRAARARRWGGSGG